MSGLNSLFDLADGMLDAFEGASPKGERHESARAARGSSPDVRAVTGPRGYSAHGTGHRAESPCTETGIVVLSRSRCQTIEAIDAATGETTWIVTSGRDRAECNSAELAQKVSALLG